MSVFKSTESERRCAERMLAIQRGWHPIGQIDYLVEDVAARYQVHRDTVYKGVRSGSPLFPAATRKGSGPKAWLHFSADVIRQCDERRLAFYRTTPSWLELTGGDPKAAPARRSAREVLQPPAGQARKAVGGR